MDNTVETLVVKVRVDKGSTKADIASIKTEFQSLGTIMKQNIKTNTSITSSFQALTTKLHRFSAVLLRAANVMGSWFKESNDYIEAVNLFAVTMGKGADAAKEYADKLQNLMGIDIKEWMSYQGSFNQLLNGFGIDDEKSNQMSQQLTQIAYDLSSLWNTDVQTAFQKVQSGMSGQIKGLKVWGINLSVAQLKETALAHGIELSTSKMTEAQKATLRYITIMEKTQNVQGDLARTIITPANAMRILSQQMTQLKRALGNIVSVLVVKFIPYVQLAVKWLTELAQRLADFFGFELPEIDYSGLDMTGAYADDLEDSLDDAADTAKKLKKTLMGFDEINTLNAPDSSDTSSLLGGGLPDDLGLDLSKYEYDFTKGIKLPDFDSIKEKLKDILWYVGTIGAGILAWNATKFISQLFDLNAGFGTFLGVAMAVVGAVVLIKGAIDALNNGVDLKNFTEMWVGVGLLVGGLALAFGAVGAKIGAIVGGVVLMVVGIKDAITEGLNWLNGTLIVGGATLTGVAIGSFFGPVGALIGGLIGLAVGAITTFIIWCTQHAEQVSSWLDTYIVTPFKNVVSWFNGIGKWINTNIITPIKNFFTTIYTALYNMFIAPALKVIGTFVSAVKEVLTTIYTRVKEIVSGIWEAVKAVATKIGEIVKTIWQIIKAVAGYVWDKVKEVAGKIWSKISEILGKIKQFLTPIATWVYNKVLKPVYDFVVKVNGWISDKISKVITVFKNVAITAVNGVTGIMKTALNGIFSIAEDIINFFIRGLNNVVDLVNEIPGVSISRVKELSIPRFAEGGFPDSGSLFIAREAGAEMVGNIGGRTAVANNDQIVTAIEGGVYRAIREANADSGGSGGDITLVALLDGDIVYRNTVKRHNDEVKATGSSPLLVGG